MGELRATSAGDQVRTLALARASSDREDWEQAVTLWAEVVAANPVDGSHWFRLAQARRHRQDLDGAIGAYERALELRHGYPAETAYMIAGCHAQLGQPEAALDRLDQACTWGSATSPRPGLRRTSPPCENTLDSESWSASSIWTGSHERRGGGSTSGSWPER